MAKKAKAGKASEIKPKKKGAVKALRKGKEERKEEAVKSIDFREKIKELLIKWGVDNSLINLEIPPDPKLGDYAFPCFGLARVMKKNPADIAREIAYDLRNADFLEKAEIAGPYVNFFVKRAMMSENVIRNIMSLKDGYGSEGWARKERIIIELVEPNTNKPLHLGHLRNAFLGMSAANIMEFIGNEVIRVNLVNDRGVHICKSMLAYELWGGGKTPESEGVKGDHFVGDYYVLFSKKAKEDAKLEQDAQDMLKRWEEGNAGVVKTWKKMNKWAIEGIRETYKKIGLIYDKEYHESDLYEQGRKMVMDGFAKGIFRRDENENIYADLDELGKKVLLRADGTSIYITQDIYLAKLKFEQYKMDRSVYVVGNEQEYHFKVLFRILKMLGLEADRCYHLSYGMVNLPEGKMKSREGKVVDADEIIEEVETMAKDEVRSRYKELNAREIDKRAKAIGLAGLRFYLLKLDPKKDMMYNPIDSISFEGDTGPYVQYTYARIMSILKKIKSKREKADYNMLKEEVEVELIKKLNRFNEAVLGAGREYKPNLICNYLLELCHGFNTFYSQCNVIKADDELRTARVQLLKSVAQVLKNGLGLLCIDVLEEM